MPDARAHVFVSGRVQGVFFRSSARARALDLGVTGWVKNLGDGRVELVAEGPRERVEELIRWCGEGPPGSLVRDVGVSWEEEEDDFHEFSIAGW